MASQSILSKTLSTITSIKLSQLQIQNDSYKNKKNALLLSASSSEEPNPAKRASILLSGAERILPPPNPTSSSSSTTTTRTSTRTRGRGGGYGYRRHQQRQLPLPSSGPAELPELSNLSFFIEQSEFDPSVGDVFLKESEEFIRGRLDAQSNKYEFASLYGKLVGEWIGSGSTSTAAEAQKEGGGDDFVEVGREEMYEQRKTWEGYVFEAKETDAEEIKKYLEGIFSGRKEVEAALEVARERMQRFQTSWRFGGGQHLFTPAILKTCINGMLRSDSLMEDKRATMREFLGNEVVLSEIADVLNVRLADIDAWKWDSPLVVEQRRNLNGRYRFYTDEDLLHSIFVYYIGLKFAVELRESLVAFATTEGVWRSDTKPISKEDLHRRNFFLGLGAPPGSPSLQSDVLQQPQPRDTVQRFRDDHFFQHILLDQLPKSFEEVRGSYGDDAQSFQSSLEEETRKSHTAVVQGLLQQLLSEVAMAKGLGKEMTVIRSDFTWFGPSLPHSSIFAVLDFFGVNQEWMDFFRRVLEAPIRFKGDSDDTPDRIRKRGTPISTPVADFFGESLLFCLDFGVNQKADGTRLYRLHDDIWLWGGVEQCVKAWDAIIEFKDIMGLDINQNKTGSVRISKQHGDAALTSTGIDDKRLPSGDVTWGFLKLDPATGRFVIRQDEVDKHIEELRLQLDGCRSVLDFVQAWNIYGYRFFVNNFGKPCQAYGRAHMDSMLATFRRIQEAISPGGVGKLLKEMIASRFGLSPEDIPDGFLYYPTSLGGLGLKNPFIEVLLRRSHIFENPQDLIMDLFHKENEMEYHQAKTRFETRLDDVYGKWRTNREYDDLREEKFMPLEEYTKYAERTSEELRHAFDRLKEEPSGEVVIEARGDVTAALVGIQFRWEGLGADEKWVVQLYHKEVVKKFGGLVIVDEGLLPTGLITMLRESRFKWQG